MQRCRDADDLAQNEGEHGAGPGDAQRAVALAGSDIGPDQGHQRPTDAEHQRDEKVFEPRGSTEARDRRGSRCKADQRGRRGDGDVGLHSADACNGPDAQDLARHRPAQRRQCKARDVAAREHVPAEHQCAEQIVEHERQAAARDTHCGDRADAEDQQRRERHQRDCAGADDQRRHEHVAGAADHARERVHQPQQNDAAEHDVGIGERRRERGALAAEQAVERPAEDQHRGAERHADCQIDHERMQHQRIGLLALSGAERARDRGRNTAAHRAGRKHLHQHHAGKYQRHAGERVSAEHSDPVRLDQSGRGLREHDQHVRPGHAQQQRHDRTLQHCARPRVHSGRLRLRGRSRRRDGNGRFGPDVHAAPASTLRRA